MIDMDAYRKAMTGNGSTPISASRVVVRGRLPASKINENKPSPQELALNTSAANTPIPIHYGRKNVPGLISAYAVSGGYLYVRVVWGMGEIYAIEKVFINDAAPVSGVSVRHYRGTTYQGVDSWLAAAIVGYADDMVLRKPGGLLAGIAYSVFKIPSSFTAAPQFQAIIQSKLVYDPAGPVSGDPFYSSVGFSLHFTGTNGQTTATDTGPNARAVTFSGNANIQSNQLALDGTTDYVQIADAAGVEFGTGSWTLEAKVTTSTIAAGDARIFSKTNTASSNYGLSIYRSAANLVVSLSANGSNYNIAGAENAMVTCFSVGVERTIVCEFNGTDYVIYVDGVERWRKTTTATMFDSTAEWTIGANRTGSESWNGSIRSAKFTKALRYGSPAPAPATAIPFSDSAYYVPYQIYSDNSALVFADVVTSTIYGLGSTVLDLAAAKDWCDDEIAIGVARAKISISLTQPQKTEAVLDLIASYADLLWVYEGESVKMIPDQPVSTDNPGGRNLIPNNAFDDASQWAYGSRWDIVGGVAVAVP